MKAILAISVLQLLHLSSAAQRCNTRGAQPCRVGFVCVEENPGDFATDVGGVCKYVSCSGSIKPCPTGSSCYFLGGAASSGTCVTDGQEIYPVSARTASPAATPTGDWCGGIIAKACPTGQVCVGAGPADQAGTCVDSSKLTCGGFANAQCPTGYKCKYDDSGSSLGKCVPRRRSHPPIPVSSAPAPVPTNARCGGFAALKCPSLDQICIDDPTDSCAPPTGADCGGICVTKTKETCAGFIGKSCSSGTCIDDPSDSCDPLNGGADCIGVCVKDYPRATSIPTPTPTPTPLQRCGTKGTENCPEGQSCFVDPASSCFGAKDCPGFCAEMGIY